MSTEAELKAIWYKFIDASEGKIPYDESFIHPEMTLHFRNGIFAAGVEGLTAQMEALFASFPGLHFTHEEFMYGGNDKFATRMKMHSGPHSGVPALGMYDEHTAGRSFVADDFHFVQVKDGKIFEQWSVPDAFTCMDQTGLVPARIEDVISLQDSK